MSIRDCTVPKSPSLMARRAVWRREPNRRRSPRRRRLRRRRSAKPRAERSSLRCVHAIGKLPRVASHLSAGSHASMRNAAAGPADKVDDGGRRRHLSSAFMVRGFGGRLMVGSNAMSSAPSAPCRGRFLCRRSIRSGLALGVARHTEHRRCFLRPPNGSARWRACSSHSFSSDPEFPNATRRSGWRRRPGNAELAASASEFGPRDRSQIRWTICGRTAGGERIALIAASIAARSNAAYLKLRPQRSGRPLMG